MTTDLRRTEPRPTSRLLDVEALCAYLMVGRTAAYSLLAPGGPLHADAVRIGRSVRIPIEAVDAWIDAQRGAGRP